MNVGQAVSGATTYAAADAAVAASRPAVALPVREIVGSPPAHDLLEAAPCFELC